jgi:hypothetical protein
MIRTISTLVTLLLASSAMAAGVEALIQPRELASGAAAQNLDMITAATIDLSGATDASVALQAFLDAYPTKRIYVPAGTPLLLHPITLNNGQMLQCEGRTQTVFQVTASFSPMTANGVISMGTGEPGGTLIDCGVHFYQPTPLTRANIIKYPPALAGANIPRWQIDRVRVSNAWQCLDARGNSGGAYLGRLECGAYADTSAPGGAAITFDGAYDFIHVSSIECWPYDTSADAANVYEDGTTSCGNFGRVDGLSIDKLGMFEGKLTINANANNTSIPIQISNLQMDGNGSTLSVAGGGLMIGNLYSTKDAGGAIGSVASITGGQTFISNAHLNTSLWAGPGIMVYGGSLTINGGDLNESRGSQPIAEVTNSGVLAVYNTNDDFPALPPRSTFFFYQNNGVLKLANNHAVAQLSSTASFLGIAQDNAGNYISGNEFPGWGHIIPSTNIGFYDLNEPDPIVLTPVFQTEGDFAPTVTARSGELFRKGDFVEFWTDTTFNTNAYTTAAGAFSLNDVPISPIVRGSSAFGGCTFSNIANVVGSGMSFPEVQSNTVYFRTMQSGTTGGDLGPANILPNITGVDLRFSCRYRVR